MDWFDILILVILGLTALTAMAFMWLSLGYLSDIEAKLDAVLQGPGAGII